MGATFINLVFEGFDADAVESIQKNFVRVAMRQVDADDLFHGIRDFCRCKGGANHLAGAGLAALTTAQGDLIELGIVLVHPQDADMGHMVVAAGVHAAGDVEVQFAQVKQVIQVTEARLDGVGDRDGLGIGQVAEVAARAADHVGEQADAGGGQVEGFGGLPEFVQAALLHVGQDQILLVGGAGFAKAEFVGELGGGFHLCCGDVAGGCPGAFRERVTAA